MVVYVLGRAYSAVVGSGRVDSTYFLRVSILSALIFSVRMQGFAGGFRLQIAPF